MNLKKEKEPVVLQEISIPKLDSKKLFGNHKRIVIYHQSMEYQLQITKAGKLILTK